MTKILARVGRYTFLVALTAVAAAVMWWVSQPNTEGVATAGAGEVASTPLAAQPRALVEVERIEPALRDVSLRYSGKIEAWETYTLGFEIGGRVAELGVAADGRSLDDGDRVTAGQVLARLDDRVLRAQLSESVARFELAASDLARSRRVRERSPTAISEADYQNDVTTLAQAKAAQEIANKSLEDSTLVSPVSGSIVRRMIEAGESVNPHEHVFEVVENDRLRLVVNVPEARVRELELRRREVLAIRRGEQAAPSPECGFFRARVRLEGNDLYGNPWPPIDAEVHRIAETADEVTGLFEVEIILPNGDGLFRPGMVATAEIVTGRVLAYSIPESAVLFRSGQTYAFTVDEEPTDMEVMFWDVGETSVARARRVDLTRWIDQGDQVLIPADSVSIDAIVTRGQQRLRDGQLVRPTGEVATTRVALKGASEPGSSANDQPAATNVSITP